MIKSKPVKPQPVEPSKIKAALLATPQSLLDLKQDLQLLLSPDFMQGDYWPKLDSRLNGRLPEIARRAILLINLLELSAHAD